MLLLIQPQIRVILGKLDGYQHAYFVELTIKKFTLAPELQKDWTELNGLANFFLIKLRFFIFRVPFSKVFFQLFRNIFFIIWFNDYPIWSRIYAYIRKSKYLY